MNEHEKEVLYSDALILWGFRAQVMKAIEECAELISALSRHVNTGCGGETVIDCWEEIADVEIMVEQLRYAFSENSIDAFRDKKLTRLRKRIDKEMEQHDQRLRERKAGRE